MNTKQEILNSLEEIYIKNDIGFYITKINFIINCITEICENNENPVCVQIGVFDGEQFLPVAFQLKNYKKGKIYAIDKWDFFEIIKHNDQDEAENRKNINFEKMYLTFKTLLKKFNLDDYVQIFKMSSDMAPVIYNINYFYLVAKHTPQVIEDIKKYVSQIQINGYCLVDVVSSTNKEAQKIPALLQTMGFEKVFEYENFWGFKKIS